MSWTPGPVAIANAEQARRDGQRTSPRSSLGKRDIAALQAPDRRAPSKGGPSVQEKREKLRRPLVRRSVWAFYFEGPHYSQTPIRNIDAYYNTRCIYDDVSTVLTHPLTKLGIDVWLVLATVASLRSLVFVSLLKQPTRLMSWGQACIDKVYNSGLDFFHDNITLDPAATTEANTPLRHEGHDYKHVAALLVAALYRHGALRKIQGGGGKLEDAGVTIAAERDPGRRPVVMDGARLARLAMSYALIADAVPEECMDQVACLYGGVGMQSIVRWVVDRAESDAELELAAKLVERFPIYANPKLHYESINAQFNKEMDKFYKEIDAGTVQGDKATVEFLCPSDSTLLEDPITITELKKLRRMEANCDALERSTLYPVFDKAVELVYGMTAKMLSRKLKRPIFLKASGGTVAPLFSRYNFRSLLIARPGWDQSVYMGLNYKVTYVSTSGRRVRIIVIEKPEVSEA